MTVVTVSASYGAGGSVIAPRVARRLGVRFVDRAIPVAVAADLGLTVDEADALAHNVTGRWAQLLAGMASLSYDFAVPAADGDDEAALLASTTAYLQEVADQGGVVLGHAAALVLADRPEALHVRLDGPAEARVDAAMRQHGIDRATAQAARRDSDKLRAGYVTHFYSADAADPALYDLVLDTTRLGWRRAEEIIVHAVRLCEEFPKTSMPRS